jgi:hypothetical protein
VKNVGIYADEGFKEICGYAESKDPAEPGNLEVILIHLQSPI